MKPYRGGIKSREMPGCMPCWSSGRGWNMWESGDSPCHVCGADSWVEHKHRHYSDPPTMRICFRTEHDRPGDGLVYWRDVDIHGNVVHSGAMGEDVWDALKDWPQLREAT